LFREIHFLITSEHTRSKNQFRGLWQEFIFNIFLIRRCTRFRFGPLLAPQILPRLKFVAEQEEVNLTGDGEKALMALSGGDMRKVKI
jgi:hypothetical protein